MKVSGNDAFLSVGFNVLPPGQYLFRIKASGNNRDRKTVFVTVK
ncbi:MAG TPA: hypothetical protein PKY50_14105 [Candidatus Competibacter sp.]|nr:hypothetical protein [Candidatus Competibacter sp.]